MFQRKKDINSLHFQNNSVWLFISSFALKINSLQNQSDSSLVSRAHTRQLSIFAESLKIPEERVAQEANEQRPAGFLEQKEEFSDYSPRETAQPSQKPAK